MRRRWALWLVLVHVAITATFVIREEVDAWDFWRHSLKFRDDVVPEPIPRWMTVVNAWAHGNRAPVAPPPDQFFMGIDYWPSSAIKGFHIVELPVALLVGWYKHPLSISAAPPLLPLVLLPGVHNLQVHTRILFLDGMVIALVALQWWVVAQVMRRKERFARWVRRPIIGITVAGVVCAVACLPPNEWHSAELIAMFSAFTALIGWLWVIGASALLMGRSVWQWGCARVHR
jgi:hypothetical protein